MMTRVATIGPIGPYEILGVLGQGAMGVVYQASHVESGRPVALKTVLVAGQLIVQSLRREIRALARIRHPGIVQIYDDGVVNGHPWYAMELLEGMSLRRFLSSLPVEDAEPTVRPSGRPPVGTAAVAAAPAARPSPRRRLEELLGLMHGICAPLAFLHGEGMVHRDLKPDNIFLRTDGTPVLVDFGLALRQDLGSGRERLETAGDIGGTAAYMAPEQIRSEPVDARTDLYALGCIFYEMLTGRKPYAGGGLHNVLLKHLTLEPIPPSRLVAGIPFELEQLVLRLLEKRPQDRIGHAADVASVLARLGQVQRQPAGVSARPRDYLYRPGFTGREAALAELGTALGRLRDGQGGLVLIGGESGIGKTRLVMELARAAREAAVRLIMGQSVAPAQSDRGAPPLHPLLQPLQDVADLCREQGPAVTERILGRRVPVLAVYQPALAEIPDLPPQPAMTDLPEEAARHRLWSFLTETFDALTDREGLLLVLDDLQWADELTLGWLESLVRGARLRQLPMLLVGTYRSDEAPGSLGRLLGMSGVQRIELGRFGEDSVRGMVGDMLAMDEPPQPLVQILTRQSEGNPFFVAEYLRATVEEQVLYRDTEGVWRLSVEASGAGDAALAARIALPSSLQQIVERRFSGLDASALRLLELASTIGRNLDGGLLAEASELPEQEMFEALSELLRRQVLEESGPGRLSFVHDKVRELAYARMDEVRRRLCHRRVAERLEARLAAGPQDVALAVLGQHWERAGNTGRAAACYLAGARQAAARAAGEDAERLYRAFLALRSEPGPDTVAARNELGRDVLSPRGRNREAIAEHLFALREAALIGDAPGEALAFQLLSTSSRLYGQLADAQSFGERALKRYRILGDRRAEGVALTVVAAAHLARGQLEKAGAGFREALAVHREVGNERYESVTLSNLAVICREQGQLGKAQELQAEALGIHRKVGNRRSEAITLENIGVLFLDRGLLDKAEACFVQALSLQRELGDRLYEALTLSSLAQLQHSRGNQAQALSQAAEALALAREVSDPLSQAKILLLMAMLRRRGAGALEAAAELIGKAEELFGEMDSLLGALACLCERGHLELAHGRPAAGLLRKALRGALDAGVNPDAGLGGAILRLRRAVEAAAASRPLVHGERAEDLPEALRSRPDTPPGGASTDI
jgi:predicted ATPase